jgi:hypothetical protein
LSELLLDATLFARLHLDRRRVVWALVQPLKRLSCRIGKKRTNTMPPGIARRLALQRPSNCQEWVDPQ